MNKKVFAKRTISIIVSLSIVLSIFSSCFGALFSSAADNCTVEDSTTATFLPKGTIGADFFNLHAATATNAKAKINKTSTGEEESATYYTGSGRGDWSALYDGTKLQLDVQAKRESNYDKYYVDIYYEFENEVNIKEIVLTHHTNASLRTEDFGLYASDSLETLYDSSNNIKAFEDNNVVEQHFIFNEALKTKVFGIRITKALQSSSSSNEYPRILEFAAYGSLDTIPVTTNSSNTATYKPVGTVGDDFYNINTEAGVTAQAKYNKRSDGEEATAELVTGEGFGAMSNLFDATKAKIGVDATKESGDDNYYVDIYYSFNYEIDIKEIVIAHDSTSGLVTEDYSLHVGNKLSTLFNIGNKVTDVKNNTDVQQNFVFDQETKARYFGIRIYKAIQSSNTTDAEYPRISEFALYGKYNPPELSIEEGSGDAKPISSITDTCYSIPAKFSLEPQAYYLNNDGAYVAGTVKYPERLTDASGGKASSEIYAAKRAATDMLDNDFYCDFYFDLYGSAIVKEVVITSRPEGYIKTNKYALYASDSKGTLFNESSLVAVIDNNDKEQQNFIFGTKKLARYVALRVYKPSPDTSSQRGGSDYPRIVEFNVYGCYEDPSFDPNTMFRKLNDIKNENFSTLTERFGESMIKNVYPSLYVDEKRAYNCEQYVKKIYNAINSEVPGEAHANLIMKKDGYIQHESTAALVFQLNHNGDIGKIKGFAFQGITTTSQPYYAAHYQIYASEEIDDIFRPESMVFEYNALADDKLIKGILYEFPANQEVLGNYFAIKFIDPCYSAQTEHYPRISLLHVYGDGVEIKGAPGNLAENMPISPYFVKDDKRTEIPVSNLSAKETAMLTDTSVDKAAEIKTKGKDTVEIIYNLCGDMVIDSIWLSTIIDANSGFKKMSVYASDLFGAIQSKDSLLWTYKVGSKTGTIKPKKAFKDPLNARYIRFVFEGVKDSLKINEIYIEGNDKQKMKTRNLTNNVTAENVKVRKVNTKTKDMSYLSIGEDDLSAFVDNNVNSYIVINDYGIRGVHTYDIIVYLGDLKTVSNIKLNFLKYLERYWPTKLNVYLAETDAELDDPNAKPVATVDYKDIKNNSWTLQVRPSLARYVRVELAEFPDNGLFYNDAGENLICSALCDVVVTGTKVIGLQTSADDQRLLTFEDKKHNAQISILRLDTNDISTDVVDAKLIPEPATDAQMWNLKPSSLEVVNKTVYRVELYDYYGNVVTDIGLRSIRVAFNATDEYNNYNAFVGIVKDDSNIELSETEFKDNLFYTDFIYETGMEYKVAFLGMVSSDSEYWGTLEEPNEEPVYDAEWYRSIHTTDGRFEVSTVFNELIKDTKFTAVDISDIATEEDYRLALSYAPHKSVAVFYDMSLTYNGEDYDLAGDYVDVYYNIPGFVSQNYTDLEVVHITDDGMVISPWQEVFDDQIYFQTESFSRYAIIGVLSEDADFENIGVSPETGDSYTSLIAILAIFIAAGYVSLNFGKKSDSKA